GRALHERGIMPGREWDGLLHTQRVEGLELERLGKEVAARRRQLDVLLRVDARQLTLDSEARVRSHEQAREEAQSGQAALEAQLARLSFSRVREVQAVEQELVEAEAARERARAAANAGLTVEDGLVVLRAPVAGTLTLLTVRREATLVQQGDVVTRIA